MNLRRYEVILVSGQGAFWSDQTWTVLARCWTVRGAQTTALEWVWTYEMLHRVSEYVAGRPLPPPVFRVEVRGPVPWRT